MNDRRVAMRGKNANIFIFECEIFLVKEMLLAKKGNKASLSYSWILSGGE